MSICQVLVSVPGKKSARCFQRHCLQFRATATGLHESGLVALQISTVHTNCVRLESVPPKKRSLGMEGGRALNRLTIAANYFKSAFFPYFICITW